MSRFVLQACVALGFSLWLPSFAWAQSETVEYYETDAVGSIRITYEANGYIVSRQDYAPFGMPLLPGTALPPEGFVGNVTDGESDQGYFVARQLQDRSGRFAQPDSLYGNMFDTQQWNRYSYALNNAVSLIDPDGLYVQCTSYWVAHPVNVTSSGPKGGVINVFFPGIQLYRFWGFDGDAQFRRATLWSTWWPGARPWSRSWPWARSWSRSWPWSRPWFRTGSQSRSAKPTEVPELLRCKLSIRLGCISHVFWRTWERPFWV
jgi:RHS repeat-associated protein